jgi:hypothetical protein
MKVHDTASITDMLDLVTRRPELFLTESTISSLQNFLSGYLLGLGFTASHVEYDFFYRFQVFFLSKYNSDIYVPRLIDFEKTLLQFNSQLSQEEAFNLFVKTWQEFNSISQSDTKE